jgi:hypothetical protein
MAAVDKYNLNGVNLDWGKKTINKKLANKLIVHFRIS